MTGCETKSSQPEVSRRNNNSRPSREALTRAWRSRSSAGATATHFAAQPARRQTAQPRARDLHDCLRVWRLSRPVPPQRP
jgi:hypothetical protein